jgi:membrane protease YdiL (CAAX protease family)
LRQAGGVEGKGPRKYLVMGIFQPLLEEFLFEAELLCGQQ